MVSTASTFLRSSSMPRMAVVADPGPPTASGGVTMATVSGSISRASFAMTGEFPCPCCRPMPAVMKNHSCAGLLQPGAYFRQGLSTAASASVFGDIAARDPVCRGHIFVGTGALSTPADRCCGP